MVPEKSLRVSNLNIRKTNLSASFQLHATSEGVLRRHDLQLCDDVADGGGGGFGMGTTGWKC